MDLPNFGVDTAPYLTYGAKSGKWKHVENKVKRDILLGELVIDLESYSTGWGKMGEGQAPQWIMNPNRSIFGAIPSTELDKDGKPAWKQGIRVTLFSPSTFGGDGIASFDTTGFGARTGIFEILQAFAAHPGRGPGLVPVVKYVGNKEHGTGQKATTIPQFEIVKFIPRPAALSGQAAPQSTPMAQAANAPAAAPAVAASSGEF
jgi:hypothetical protein